MMVMGSGRVVPAARARGVEQAFVSLLEGFNRSIRFSIVSPSMFTWPPRLMVCSKLFAKSSSFGSRQDIGQGSCVFSILYAWQQSLSAQPAIRHFLSSREHIDKAQFSSPGAYPQTGNEQIENKDSVLDKWINSGQQQWKRILFLY